MTRSNPVGAIAAILLAAPLWLWTSPAGAQEDAQASQAPLPSAVERFWSTRPGAQSAEELDAIDAERAARRSLPENRMRERIGRYLAAAGEVIEKEGAEAAGALLDRLNANRMNDQERARLYMFRAYIAYEDGDVEGAIGFFEQALAQDILPVKDEVRIRLNIAQLYAGLQDWEKTLGAIDRWMAWAREPDPLVFYLKAIAHFQLDQFDAAIQYAGFAVDMSDTPREGWLQLLAALYIEKEDYDNAAPVLEELVLRYPKKAYWVQLSLIYGALEKYPRSLSVQQVAYAQDLLDDDKELRRLARSYLFANVPYQAAQVLDKGLEDGLIEEDAEVYEMLANSWIAAREYERSLPPLEKAASLSDDGNLYVRLGQVYLQSEDWENAIPALEKAVSKGSLRNPGTALLLLGIASYNTGRVDMARSYFVRARSDEKSRAAADGWITHLDNEAQSTADASAAPETAEGEDGSNPT